MRILRLRWALLAGVLVVSTPAHGQPTVLASQDLTTAGTDCAVPTSCIVLPEVSLSGVPSLGVYVDVGVSGTFQFEATLDGASWFAVADDVSAETSVTADTARFFSNPGYRAFRVRASALSGAARVTFARGASGLRSTASLTADGIEVGAQPANNPHFVRCSDGGTAAPCDVALDAADPGVAAIVSAIQGIEVPAPEGGATETTLSAINTKTPTLVTGRVPVDGSGVTQPVSGTVSVTNFATLLADTDTIAGTLSTIDVDTGNIVTAVQAIDNPVGSPTGGTAGTASFLAGGVYNSTPPTLTNGQQAGVQLDTSGRVIVNCGAGCSGGGGTSDTDDGSIAGSQTVGLSAALNHVWNGSAWVRATSADATHGEAAFSTGPQIMGVGSSSAPSAVDGGDAVRAWYTLNGAQVATLTNASGTNAFGTAGSAASPVVSVQGIASMTPLTVTATNLDVQIGGSDTVQVQSNSANLATQTTAAAIQTAVETLDNIVSGAGANISQIGGASPDPCLRGTKIAVAISQTTSTQLFTGTASNRIYVCSFAVTQPSTSTQTWSLVNGTGTVCGTGTAGMIGGASAANGLSLSMAFGNGGGTIAKSTADAANVCLLQSGSDRLAGVLTYVVASNTP